MLLGNASDVGITQLKTASARITKHRALMTRDSIRMISKRVQNNHNSAIAYAGFDVFSPNADRLAGKAYC